MAEGSGSEPASVPPTTAPAAATATVSYAKIAAVTSDNDPAAAVIVVNKEDTAASEAQGCNSIHFKSSRKYSRTSSRNPNLKRRHTPTSHILEILEFF